jgi:hypothetical protein
LEYDSIFNTISQTMLIVAFVDAGQTAFVFFPPGDEVQVHVSVKHWADLHVFWNCRLTATTDGTVSKV